MKRCKVLVLCCIYFSGEASAQSLYDKSANYTQAYIIQSERNMVEPIPTPYGLMDTPGVTLSVQTLNLNSPSGNTVQERMEQQNEVATNQNTQPTQEEINKGNYYESLAQAEKDKEQEIYSLINDIPLCNKNMPPPELTEHQITKLKLMRLVDTTAPDYEEKNSIYWNAAKELIYMLSGKEEIILKRAVFITENAYYNNTLDYTKYSNQIDSLVGLCKAIIHYYGDSPDNKLCCNYAIQALYADTLHLTRTEKFYPFIYDFNDFFGDKDLSQLFVTKLLNTGMGQCHSMPLLYLILAEELHTDAYLALCPVHSYIMFPFDSDLYDFETTCGKPNTDGWIMRSGFVSPIAVKNGIYLTPLTMRQTIAQCLIDLVNEYTYQLGQGPFAETCCHIAAKYFPTCLSAYQCLANYRLSLCENLAQQYHFPPLNEYSKYPGLKERFDDMVKYQMQVDSTGYVTLTPDEYIKMISLANSEKEKRKENQLRYSIYLQLQNRKQ